MSEWDTVRVYLDGLDELSSSERQERIADLARVATSENNALQIILTARDYDYGPNLKWLPKLQIKEFSDVQVRRLVEKWLNYDNIQISLLYSQLDNAKGLQTLMRIPLLATLILMVFRQSGELPKSRARLYDMFINLLSIGWDLAKGLQRFSSFDLGEKLLILSRLASQVLERAAGKGRDQRSRRHAWHRYFGGDCVFPGPDHDQHKPVILVGAQRPASDPDSDGPRNLLDAVRVAVASEAADKGAMVVMNGQINAARDVTKTNPSQVETFRSPEFGALGVVDEEKVRFYRAPLRRQTFPLESRTQLGAYRYRV